MASVTLVLVGVGCVLGGVLVLRMHAFLALVLAGLVVGALTPAAVLESHQLGKAALRTRVDGEQIAVLAGSAQGLTKGTRLPVLRPQGAWRVLTEIGELEITDVTDESDKPRAEARFTGRDGATFRPDDVVVPASARKSARSAAQQTLGDRLGAAFGSTCGKIGILIAMASIVGKCLLDSGAADRIVRSATRWCGEARAPVAFLVSGFVLAIPVFFDTVFYLMMPLGKALHLRTRRSYLLYILAIIAGGTMAHSLVPPTPGPLFAAEALNVDLGLMILGGSVVGFAAALAGFCWALFADRRWPLPMRESPDALAALEDVTRKTDDELPPLWLSLLPILLPVAMISGRTCVEAWQKTPGAVVPPWVASWSAIWGHSDIALTLSAAIGLATLAWKRRASLKELAQATQVALADGGQIILITAAGGAFGNLLQQTGITGLIRSLPPLSDTAVLTVAFLITAAVRTAQGSATVAMITAVGVLGAFAEPGVLHCHSLYLALAIGCGSKPIAWMNDSGFWVICKMTGMTETEGLRAVSPMTILMGTVGLGVTLLGAMLFPLQ